MEPPYILQLPMEILQHIASFADAETSILHMRLTCKDLAAAAFDRFADEYIANLCSFAFDPSRLRRIESITATPHLARKVRKVTFTLDPFEHCEEMPFAAPIGEHREDAMDIFMQVKSAERLTIPGCPGAPLYLDKTDLFKVILGNLQHFSKCTVGLNAVERFTMECGLRRFCMKLLDDVVKVAAETGVEIDEMHLSDLIRLDDFEYSRLGRIGPLLPTLASVKTFHYQQNFALGDGDEEYDVLEQEAVSQKNVLCDIMRQFKSLEDFHWDAPYDLWSSEYVSCQTSTLFNIHRMDRLRILSLGNITCDTMQLSDTLAGCCSTLTTLKLNLLSLNDIDDAWTKVFHVMRDMSVLEKIGLYHLNEANDTDRRDLLFLLPGDTTFKRYGFVPFGKLLDAGPFLDLNLDRGLTYYYEIDHADVWNGPPLHGYGSDEDEEDMEWLDPIDLVSELSDDGLTDLGIDWSEEQYYM